MIGSCGCCGVPAGRPRDVPEPFARIGQRMVIAATGERRGANADGDARLVHHPEHDGEALPHVADEKADGASRPLGLFASRHQMRAGNSSCRDSPSCD